MYQKIKKYRAYFLWKFHPLFKIFISISMFLLCMNSYAQKRSHNLREIDINQKIKEYADTVDLTTPLNSFISFTYAMVQGYDSLQREMSSQAIRGRMSIKNSDNTTVSDNAKMSLLETTIDKIVIYKDSVAGIIVNNMGFYTIRYLYLENGVWLNAGEGLGGDNLTESQNIFLKDTSICLDFVRRISQLEQVSTDTLAFINYLKNNGGEPVDFLLGALETHKIVLYGELHFREASWDLMKRLVKSPKFSQTTSTIFVELSVSAQSGLDRFLGESTKNPNIILDIFRKEELTGWNDKGMYEFLLVLWDVNAQLPEEKRIKIIAADFPRPFYSTLTSKEQYTDLETKKTDRNVYMSTIIEHSIHASSDKRHGLFIVGYAHAYKSAVLDRSLFQETGRSTGSLLSEKFSKDSVFSVFTHSPMIANNGYLYGKLRKGLFDYAFMKYGEHPVAFNLHNSPFGREHFDAVTSICFNRHAGTFEDNFDGYIFFEPLKEELSMPPLYELFTDDFIEEIKRRAMLIGAENSTFQGIKIKDLERNQLILRLKNKEQNRRFI